jgi:hypothetical protein
MPLAERDPVRLAEHWRSWFESSTSGEARHTVDVDPRLRTVNRLPLTGIWDDDGPVPAQKGDEVGSDAIRAFLRTEPGALVEAAIGERILWHTGTARVAFWKERLRDLLVEPGKPTVGGDDDRLFIVHEWFLDETGERVLVAEGSS